MLLHPPAIEGQDRSRQIYILAGGYWYQGGRKEGSVTRFSHVFDLAQFTPRFEDPDSEATIVLVGAAMHLLAIEGSKPRSVAAQTPSGRFADRRTKRRVASTCPCFDGLQLGPVYQKTSKNHVEGVLAILVLK